MYREPCPSPPPWNAGKFHGNAEEGPCASNRDGCSITPDGVPGHGGGATPVTATGHSALAPVPSGNARAAMQLGASPELLGQSIYTFPLLPVDEQFPNPCALGVLGSDVPRGSSLRPSADRLALPALLPYRSDDKRINLPRSRARRLILPRRQQLGSSTPILCAVGSLCAGLTERFCVLQLYSTITLRPFKYILEPGWEGAVKAHTNYDSQHTAVYHVLYDIQLSSHPGNTSCQQYSTR